MKIIFQFVFLFLISSSISAQKKSGTIIYKIANIDLVNKDNNIDVANWPNGLYFLRVSIDEIISSRKIIVQH